MRYLFVNPFFIFVVSISSSFILYRMGLSGFYDGAFSSADYMMCFVLFVSLIASIGFHKFVKRRLASQNDADRLPKYNLLFLVLISISFFVLEILHAGGIPIIYIMRGVSYDYTQFGIPTLHVAFLGYYSVAAVVSYERYISIREKKYLIPVALAIIYNVCIVNRGALLITLASLLFVYMYSSRKRLKAFFVMLIMLFCITIVFGYIGDKRMISSGYENSDAIYDIGRADPVFRELPTGFFWVYIYASSTYANLVSQGSEGNINTGGIMDFINFSILPDFISKYTIKEGESFNLKLIAPELTVGTAFGRAFVILGYAGIVALAFWYSVVVWLVVLVNRNKKLISACSILCSVSLFMSFDNMLVFASFVLQMIFLSLYSRLRFGRYRLL